jgi:hypothetical protein
VDLRHQERLFSANLDLDFFSFRAEGTYDDSTINWMSAEYVMRIAMF